MFPIMFPDDSQKELAAVLCYMAGRMLSREEICAAIELPRSTYYAQLAKGTLITADNLRRAAANLRINGAELLTRYRMIDPAEVASLAEEIEEPARLPAPRAGAPVRNQKKSPKRFPSASRLHRRDGVSPLPAANST